MSWLVPVELVALVAIGVVPLPEQIPRAILLVAVASAARWVRGKSWAELVRGPSAFAGIGAAAGVVALVLAVVVGTPAIEALTGRGVEWSQYPMVRGSGQQLFAVATLVAFSALASELALRGWVVERALELGAGKEVAVMVGGFAEMIVSDGEFAARLGAAAFGFALGWMYVAAGRSVVAPVCARVAFVLGALLLQGLRLIG